jgi:V/A-type H+-transporting ATPase subunit D
MARLSLSKSALSKQSRQLKAYERFLPSLNMKRKQLMVEYAKARQRLETTQQDIEALRRRVGAQLPMLANHEVELEELLRIDEVLLDWENLVGARLPVLQEVRVTVRDYGFIAKPHWVDRVVIELRRMLELDIGRQIEKRRLELLNTALRKVTQRVNLFEKVLIPRTQENIRNIRIFLSDAERAAVVRSKIAKGKRAKEGLA